MKKMLCVFLLLLISCSAFKPTAYEYVDDYAQFEVAFNECLQIPLEEYYLYFYSPSCHLCITLKEEIIRYASEHNHLFVISPFEDVLYEDDPYLCLNADTYQEISIAGYPTVMKIKNKVVFEVFYGVKDVKEELNLQ